MAESKLYCVFSRQAISAMNGNRGKLASMAGHAFLHTIWNADEFYPESVQLYRDQGRAYKITLIAEDDQLDQLNEIYASRCGTSMVVDAGLTVFKGPTRVCLGIGPIDPDSREDILKNLKPLI